MKKYLHALLVLVVILMMLSANVFAQSGQDKYLENGRFKVGQRDCEKSERDTTIKNRAEKFTPPPGDQTPEYQRKVNIENKPDPLPPVTKQKQQRK